MDNPTSKLRRVGIGSVIQVRSDTEATEAPIRKAVRVVLPPEAGRGEGWADELPFHSIGGPLVIDASALTLVEPLFVARLGACIDFNAGNGHTVEVLPPCQRDVANHLSRMGLLEGLPADCTFPLKPVGALDQQDVLVPLTRIGAKREVDSLAERLSGLLRGQLGSDAEATEPLVTGLGELAGNAAEHGRSSFGAYVAAQSYEPTRCVLSVGDLGVGVRRHLESVVGASASDEDALAQALRPGVSGAGGRGRGTGLPDLIDTLRGAELPEASLRIWSGRGRLSVSLRHGRVASRCERPCRPATPGTWVVLSLSAE